MKNILFYGAGNMARAICTGIINSQFISPKNIFIYDANKAQYEKFHSDCIRVDDINVAFSEADFVFLCVKPQNIKDVLNSISAFDFSNKIFVSICAGITINSIENQLANAKIIRTMPNTPLLIGQGVTAICKNSLIEASEFEFVKSIFSASGIVIEVNEEDINAITAITSSSPAYVYSFIRAMCNGAKSIGFDNEKTLELVCKTLIGSSNMVLNSTLSLDDQIKMVKSPNGTTEAALNVLESKEFENSISEAMIACKNRAEELSLLNK